MWEHLPDADLEREYSPSSLAPGFQTTVASYTTLSRRVLATHASCQLPYGSHGDEYAILLEAKAPARPVMVVYLHGGYWQELSAEDSCFPAAHFLARGIDYAAVNYTLTPGATVGGIVGQCARALATLARARPDHAMVLAGSSAGAHLAAMMTMLDWRVLGERPPLLCGVLLLSGIYDLRPLVRTYINAPLGLDTASAWALSPLSLAPQTRAPTLICWGERETAEFKRQSRAYAAHLADHANPTHTLEVPGRDHFDILFDIGQRDTVLGQAVSILLGDNT